MDKESDGLGADFALWKQLTDEYEKALEAMSRGEPGARERALGLSRALRQLHPVSTVNAGD
ncbi:hypothetical protein VLK31_03300 [Variovorax sp. H27-G14]|uniref:hypothetical protein n=1 Tax=Variovorax sp. H27-G14 TaxID=3111914 RepID=UPI0038FCC962